MARKKTKMQKQVEKDEGGTSSKVAKGEQMPLLDVGPKNAKAIVKTAILYKATMKKRIEIATEEAKLKAKLIAQVKEENLTPLEDGVIRFTVDGFTITATPRDILLQVTEE